MMRSQTIGRFFRYVLTGGTAAVVDLSVFTGLHALGLPILVAGTLSFCLAALVNYSLTSKFVFAHRGSGRHLALFVAVAAIGYVINNGVTLICHAAIPFSQVLSSLAHVIGAPQSWVAPLAVAPARACGIAVAFVFNFYVNSTYVFRRAPA